MQGQDIHAAAAGAVMVIARGHVSAAPSLRPPARPRPRPCPQSPAPATAPARRVSGSAARTPRVAAAPAQPTVAGALALGTRPQRPGIVPAAPRAPRAPGTFRRPPLPPRSASPRAPLAAPRHSRGARPPCTLEHRASSLCQLLWILAAVGSGCRASPPEAGRWGGGWPGGPGSGAASLCSPVQPAPGARRVWGLEVGPQAEGERGG